jgi:hypothetical protein
MLRFLRREQGSALLIALGTMTVFAIVGTTLTYYTTRNAASADVSKGDGYSFSFAEAGLHNALAVLSNPVNDPVDPEILPLTTSNYNGNRAEWSGTYNDTLDRWEITSTGYVANPTGSTAAEIKRTLTAKVPIYPKQTQPLAFNAWNYLYSWGTGDPSGCDMWMDSSQDISTRVMVTGNLCMSSSAQLFGSTTELDVGGQLKIFGSAHVGASGSPIGRADVGSCKYESNAVHSPCGSADKVWASTITSTPVLEPTPSPDWNGWYKKASPGPYHPCETSSGTPPTFDNDQGTAYDPTRRNRSVSGSFNLTGSSSYTCRTTLNGQVFGELSWNNSTKVLTTKGTVFIDGNASITQTGSYTGQGTLYLSGSMLISGRMCAVLSGSNCNFANGAWDPNTKLFTIVANGTGGQLDVDSTESINLISSSAWQGALYGGAGGKVRVESSSQFAGPIIADEVDLESSIDASYFGTIGTAPTGMPGNTTVNAQPDKPQLFSG